MGVVSSHQEHAPPLAFETRKGSPLATLCANHCQVARSEPLNTPGAISRSAPAATAWQRARNPSALQMPKGHPDDFRISDLISPKRTSSKLSRHRRLNFQATIVPHPCTNEKARSVAGPVSGWGGGSPPLGQLVRPSLKWRFLCGSYRCRSWRLMCSHRVTVTSTPGPANRMLPLGSFSIRMWFAAQKRSIWALLLMRRVGPARFRVGPVPHQATVFSCLNSRAGCSTRPSARI